MSTFLEVNNNFIFSNIDPGCRIDKGRERITGRRRPWRSDGYRGQSLLVG